MLRTIWEVIILATLQRPMCVKQMANYVNFFGLIQFYGELDYY